MYEADISSMKVGTLAEVRVGVSTGAKLVGMRAGQARYFRIRVFSAAVSPGLGLVRWLVGAS